MFGTWRIFIEFSSSFEAVSLTVYYKGIIFLLFDHECQSKYNTSEWTISEWLWRLHSSETFTAGAPNFPAVSSIAKVPRLSAKCFSGVCTALTLCRMCRDVDISPLPISVKLPVRAALGRAGGQEKKNPLPRPQELCWVMLINSRWGLVSLLNWFLSRWAAAEERKGRKEGRKERVLYESGYPFALQLGTSETDTLSRLDVSTSRPDQDFCGSRPRWDRDILSSRQRHLEFKTKTWSRV